MAASATPPNPPPHSHKKLRRDGGELSGFENVLSIGVPLVKGDFRLRRLPPLHPCRVAIFSSIAHRLGREMASLVSLYLTRPEVRHLPNVGLGEPGGDSPRTLHHGVRGLTPPGSPRKTHCLPREIELRLPVGRFAIQSPSCDVINTAESSKSNWPFPRGSTDS